MATVGEEVFRSRITRGGSVQNVARFPYRGGEAKGGGGGGEDGEERRTVLNTTEVARSELDVLVVVGQVPDMLQGPRGQ